MKKTKTIKSLEYKIKTISAKEAHIVRHPVLRDGKPIESCIFEGDNLETTIHLGIFFKNKLVGVCSFFNNSNPNIPETYKYQLRGMAILSNHQSKGFGNIILKHGEHLCKEKNIKKVWCNARKRAVNFYKKNGYQIIGKPFTIKDIGLHYTMFKAL